MLLPLMIASVSIPQLPTTQLSEQCARPSSEHGTNATKGCGAYCVAIAGRRAGVEGVRFAVAERLTDPDGDGICSLADLATALDRLGVRATPMHWLADGLPPGLNILHVRSIAGIDRPDHFVVSEELGDGKYRFYVPPSGSAVDEASWILELWGGQYVQVEPLDEPLPTTREILLMAIGLVTGGVFARLKRRNEGSK